MGGDIFSSRDRQAPTQQPRVVVRARLPRPDRESFDFAARGFGVASEHVELAHRVPVLMYPFHH